MNVLKNKKSKRILIFSGIVLILAAVSAIYFLSGANIRYLNESIDMVAYSSNWKHDSGNSYYKLEYVVYCENPSDESRQCLNIYVPEVYLNSDGSINYEGQAGVYTAATAPILYVNGVAGYSEAAASSLGLQDTDYIEEGFVVVSVASRGKQTTSDDGTYIGKAPEGLVDLKAGIRFLRANADYIPGDTERIISMGTSAGGAMSALLGTTGNNSYYDDYLENIGAMMDYTDDVYASMCYCPITDLENADGAYEWMFQSDPDKKATDFELALSSILAEEYISYANGLELFHPETGALLQLDEEGSGSLKDYLLQKIGESASKYYTSKNDNPDYSWLMWDGDEAVVTDFEAFVQNYCSRSKACTAFDNLTGKSAENQVMGNENSNYVHFNSSITTALELLQVDFPEEYEQYAPLYTGLAEDDSLAEKIYLMNPMNFIEDDNDGIASHFRIRTGAKDSDTSFLISLNLGLKLQNTGVHVDQEFVWDEGHGSADYEGEFIQWVHEICR